MRVNISQGIDRLCYRYPSPLVDAVTEHEPGRRIVAVKNVTVNEDFFQGHFPGAPLMPGVLMIETLAQVATILLMHGPDGDADGARLPARRRQREVPPAGRAGRSAAARGDARARGGRARARARASRIIGDTIVAEAELLMGLVDGRAAATRPASRSTRRRSSIRTREIGAGTVVGPHAVIGEHVRDRPRLPHRRVVGRRRLDRDRRRQRDLPVRVDRADPAGPEVQRRADAAGRSATATSSASS